MTTPLDDLVVRFLGDGTSYLNMLRTSVAETRAAAADVQGVAARIEGFGRTLTDFASSVTSKVLGAAGVVGVLGSVFKGINLAAEAEANAVAFGVMFKSMDKGKQLVQDLQQFAAATPLNTADLQTAAKTLLQFGVAGDDLLPIMQQLGDVTGGDAQKFNHMALAFGQMSASGRLMGQDLLQMISGGFNPLQEISRTSGKSMAVLKQQMEKGAISVQMVRDAFKSATGPGGQFFEFMKSSSKGLKGLFSTMQDDIGGALRQIGEDVVDVFHLKDAMMAVSAGAQALTQFLKGISPTVREIAGSVWSTVSTNATAAWDAVTSAVSNFVSFFQPVIQAASSFAVAAWEEIRLGAWALADSASAVFTEIGNFATDVWTLIAGNAGLTWDSVRSAVVDALTVGEFVVRNFGDVAALVWKQALLSFLTFGNDVEHFFTQVVPAAVEFFARDWEVRLGDVFNWTLTVFQNIADNVVTLFSNIPDLLVGAISFEDVVKSLKPLADGFQRASEEFVAPQREEGAFEAQVRKEVEDAANALGEGLAEFRDRKAKELGGGIFSVPELKKAERLSYGAGQKIGDALGKGAKHGSQKLDAALFGSQEALSRILAFQDAIEGKSAGKDIQAVAAGSQDAKDLKVQNDQLKELKKIAAKPGIKVEGAGIA